MTFQKQVYSGHMIRYICASSRFLASLHLRCRGEVRLTPLRGRRRGSKSVFEKQGKNRVAYKNSQVERVSLYWKKVSIFHRKKSVIFTVDIMCILCV